MLTLFGCPINRSRGRRISLAFANGVIDAATEKQAGLAKDARNLVHPGKALRSGEACNKATALTALAAVYRVIDQLKLTR